MKEFCPYCHGEHEPEQPTDWLEFSGGKRYTAPFFCLCCGKRICGPQFGYGRACGACDLGACQPYSTAYRPEAAHPERRSHAIDEAEVMRQVRERIVEGLPDVVLTFTGRYGL